MKDQKQIVYHYARLKIINQKKFFFWGGGEIDSLGCKFPLHTHPLDDTLGAIVMFSQEKTFIWRGSCMCCYFLAAHAPASIFLQFPTALKAVQGPFWSTADLVFKLDRHIGTLTIPLTYNSTGSIVQLPASAPDKLPVTFNIILRYQHYCHNRWSLSVTILHSRQGWIQRGGGQGWIQGGGRGGGGGGGQGPPPPP